METGEKQIVNDYLRQREIYLQNAKKFHDAGRYRKSSELLWGAISQTIKALAATSSFKIFKHTQFRQYIRNISKELSDRKLLTDFWLMEDLHKNFYDEKIPQDEYGIYMELAVEYLAKLDKMIDEKMKVS